MKADKIVPRNGAPFLSTKDLTVARLVREIPHESRFTVLKRRVVPRLMSECKGTPRRGYEEKSMCGIRYQNAYNPYVKLNKSKRYVLDNWPSRDWENWDPRKCYVRGSRKRYDVPKDMMPYKDELGLMHPPRVSGRYRADIEKQYYMNGLPWVWHKDYFSGSVHYHDNEPVGPKWWYKKEFKKEAVKAAMRTMDEKVAAYRKETRDKRNYSWWESVVHGMAGEDLATQYLRKRKVPKM